MKVIRNAILQFGLVNIAVGLASTASEETISFRQLERKTMKPLKQKMVNEKDQIVPPEEIVKGFEYDKDQFIAIEEDELDGLSAERDSVITLSKFVEQAELHPLQIKTTYYLLANKNLPKPYELLEMALASTKPRMIAVGTSSLWGKESPCAVSCDGGILLLHLLWCADEYRRPTGAGDNLRGGLSEQELTLAQDILVAMRGTLNDNDLQSISRQKLRTYLGAKLTGKTVEREKSDLEALQASVDLLGALHESVTVARKAPRRPLRKKAAAKK